MQHCLALLPRVQFLQGLELLYEGLVLVLEDRHPVLQTLDVLLLLVPALPGGLAVLHQPHLALPHRLLGVALRPDDATAAHRDPRSASTAASAAGDDDLKIFEFLIFAWKKEKKSTTDLRCILCQLLDIGYTRHD